MLRSKLALILLFCSIHALSWAQAPDRPLRALLVTGGCCHDYDRQKLILPRGISARTDVEWTVVQQGGSGTNAMIPLYEDPNWADGFDVIVHNECFADVKDQAWVERILKPHREGKPAVLIHCAMHCYRTGNDAWFEFCGVQSPGHGPHYAYKVDNLKADHYIMQGFGPQWAVPKGELYDAIRVFPTAVPLAQAPRQSDNKPQVCVWTNQYHQARVFATTIGHYNETMAEPTYLDMITRGLLWSVYGDRAPAIRKTTSEQNAEITKLVAKDLVTADNSKCCQQGNLAYGKSTSASSEETYKNNFAKMAVDGNLNTRWCANSPDANQWLKIDLGKSEPLKSVRLYWEQSNNAYQYLIEASADDQKWKTVIDATKNAKMQRVITHRFDATDARYVRVTYLGSKTGGWGSLFEVEVSGDELPELPIESNPASGNEAVASDVEALSDFDVRLFAAPPQVNYPVCLTAAPTGEVFVGVDEQGSLGKKPGRGRILRCRDTDGDGTADQINKFADIDHPRGLVYDQGNLWVLHPPTLSLLIDKDGDGVADEKKTLIENISTEQVDKRGADHTTNGIRMGIDGWIYIAVGDFGFVNAKGTDGRTLSRRGGGIVRVRPDGTDMEVYSWGQRNILDVCIDPFLNMFTRDNTNDGGGWNVRVTHILQGAEYGYPSRYINFAEETMPPMADYGGGSGCGGMYVYDSRWPNDLGNAALTCDWGTSQVYRHRLHPDGATFAPDQDVFLKLPRPTDIDIDGSGRMYVSSWKNGGFDFSDPNVGFVAQIVPKNFLPKPFPDVTKLPVKELIRWMRSGDSVAALAIQREFIRRGQQPESLAALLQLTRDGSAPLAGRVAALFTYKQVAGNAANSQIKGLMADAKLRRWVLRTLTDRLSELSDVPVNEVVAALNDPDPTVQSQALISLSRLAQGAKQSGAPSLNGNEIATKILPLSVVRNTDGSVRDASVKHDIADSARVIPHLAMVALRNLNANEACLAAVSGPHRSGALVALREMHSARVVDGLIQLAQQTHEAKSREALLDTLARLYFKEAEYTRGDWWGTRPDNRGPYYSREAWDESSKIGQVLTTALNTATGSTAEALKESIKKYQLPIGDAPSPAAMADAPQKAITIAKADPNNPAQIGNQDLSKVAEKLLTLKGDAAKGKALFTGQSCNQCHTDANGQTPKGPHLVDIGKRYKRSELIESIIKPSAKLAQGFDTWVILTAEGKVLTGFVVLESAETVTIRQANGLAVEIPQGDIEDRKKQELSMMPTGLVDVLTAEQFADLLAYLESLH